MTSLQSTLDNEEGIAAELAANQREISIAEFFEKNKHMLGFDSGARGLVTAVKEAVDNALDATEEAGILPDIYVQISESQGYYRVIVEDNGPGITKEHIPRVFGKLLYGSRFHRRAQARGQQGIGISAAVLYSQLTSGKPAKITSRIQGKVEAEYFELIIDTDTNEPAIQTERTTSWDRPHGTRIELEMEANMRARTQLHDYIKQTAVVNPHARIEMHEPSESFKFERATDQLPDETEEIRPHPHGVELGTVIKMLGATNSHSLSGFLQEEFTRVGRKTAESIIDAFRDHHFGREMSWRLSKSDRNSDIVSTVEEATANKGQAATSAFAQAIESRLTDKERITHSDVVQLVSEAARDASERFDIPFGETVQTNTVEAVWVVIMTDCVSDVYAIVDHATSNRKDDAVLHGLAERITEKFSTSEDHRYRATRSDLRQYVDRAADMTADIDEVSIGATARDNIVDAIWNHMQTVPDDVPSVREIASSRDAASQLVAAMRETDIMAPPTNCLAPISAELVEAGLKKEFSADFYAAATRDAKVHAGDPFIVEAGIAYGGDLHDEGCVEVLRFANRVPLVYQRGACATTDVIKRIGWRNYGLDQSGGSGIPHGPAVIMVHVASTNVPFTSESKDAIANVPTIEDEIELAVREAARELKSFLTKRRSLQQRRQKQDVLASILPQMAVKVADITGQDPPNIDDALARIMNNVLVDRRIDGGKVTIVIENLSGSTESLELTDIVTTEPTNLSDGATMVEIDGEWFVSWSTTVSSGEEEHLTYEISDEASFDLDVQGVDDDRLTIVQ